MAIPDTISYSEFRAHLATYLDNVVNDSLPLVVKRKDGKKIIIVDADQYNAMDETAYLLSTPANQKALMEAMKEPAKNRKKYKSADDIRKEFGIK